MFLSTVLESTALFRITLSPNTGNGSFILCTRIVQTMRGLDMHCSHNLRVKWLAVLWRDAAVGARRSAGRSHVDDEHASFGHQLAAVHAEARRLRAADAARSARLEHAAGCQTTGWLQFTQLLGHPGTSGIPGNLAEM